MAENAMDMNASAVISMGSPAGLDDLASPYSIMLLYRPGSGFATSSPFISKMASAAGWSFGRDTASALYWIRTGATNHVYSSTSFTGTGTSTWYWLALTFDFSLGATLKTKFLISTFGGGSFSDLGTTVTTEGIAPADSDAAANLLVGNEGSFWGTGQDMDVAAVGIVSGKKSAAELQTIVSDVQGTSWLALWGKPTVNTGFPLLLSTASGAAAGTASGGTRSVVTDAPDWYTTAGGGGGAAAAVTRGRGINRGFSISR